MMTWSLLWCGPFLTPVLHGGATLTDSCPKGACIWVTGWLSTVCHLEHRACLQAKYEEALRIAPESAKKQRAVYYANLAACHLRTKHFEDAVQDSTAALELEPEYVKALLRRAAAYEELDDLEHALADNTKVRLSLMLELCVVNNGLSTRACQLCSCYLSSTPCLLLMPLYCCPGAD